MGETESAERFREDGGLGTHSGPSDELGSAVSDVGNPMPHRILLTC